MLNEILIGLVVSKSRHLIAGRHVCGSSVSFSAEGLSHCPNISVANDWDIKP